MISDSTNMYPEKYRATFWTELPQFQVLSDTE
jgi:hypothetical protein